MKKSFLIPALLISCYSFGQPAIKLYGYSQVFTPGMVRERDFSDTSKKAWRSSIAYYLYVGTTASVQLQPKEVWIKGIRHNIVTATMVKTPVISETEDLLVPKTSLKVRELKWSNQVPTLKTPPSWLTKLTKENDLVIAYYWKGKKYYKALKKINELETVSLQ